LTLIHGRGRLLFRETAIIPFARQERPPEARKTVTRRNLIRKIGKGRMTRQETLLLLISQALANGFEFRRWFQANISQEWPGTDEAIEILIAESRFYALVFSHEFARAFWKKGAQMSFIVPSVTYTRMNAKGEVETISRKPFTRRTIKADVWKYHLRQMVLSEDPLRYLKRFLPIHEELRPQMGGSESLPGRVKPQKTAKFLESSGQFSGTACDATGTAHVEESVNRQSHSPQRT
jgi:hypothetical protein